MRCLVCKVGSMVESRSSYFSELENCYVIIENVPCRKCTQCGEVLYSASMMEKMDVVLEKCTVGLQ